MPSVPFSQVDVFAEGAYRGNPVAVVHLADAQQMSSEAMQSFARWTNLSETTFLLPPQDPAADYRLRIFTPGGELPFAGHPTLGSCRAWLAAGGAPQQPGVVVQECQAGLIRVRVERDRLAFAAPPLVRSGEPEGQLLAGATEALGITPADVVAASWVVNGPHWLGLLLRDAEAVLALNPDFAALGALLDESQTTPQEGERYAVEVGVIGPYAADSSDSSDGSGRLEGRADYEVRAFCPDLGVPEDPVTGSLNAGLALWLVGAGLAPPAYLVSQGTALERAGRVHVDSDGEHTWVGGRAQVLVRGTVELPTE